MKIVNKFKDRILLKRWFWILFAITLHVCLILTIEYWQSISTFSSLSSPSSFVRTTLVEPGVMSVELVNTKEYSELFKRENSQLTKESMLYKSQKNLNRIHPVKPISSTRPPSTKSSSNLAMQAMPAIPALPVIKAAEGSPEIKEETAEKAGNINQPNGSSLTNPMDQSVGNDSNAPNTHPTGDPENTSDLQLTRNDPTLKKSDAQVTKVNLSYVLKASLSFMTFTASGEMNWVQEGDTYRIRFEVHHALMGSRAQSSEGEYSQQFGLKPLLFTDQVRSDKETVTFNRDTSQLEFSNNTPTTALFSNAQDQLSSSFQLGHWLTSASPLQPTPSKGSRIAFQLVSKKEAETREFEYIGQEQVITGVGKIDAVKLLRIPRSSDDQKAEIWISPKMGGILVRLRLEEKNGDYVDQVISGINGIK